MAIMDIVAALQPTFRSAPIADLAARIARFRQASYATLPEDYEAFLAANGHLMFFPDNRVAVPGSAAQVRLNSLYGVDDEPKTLFSAHEMYGGRLPPGVIAIGDSGGGGDLICLDAAGLRPGTVFHWDHEREVDAAGNRQPDFSNMVVLGDSFTQMMERVLLRTAEAEAPPRVKKATLRF